MLKNRRYRMAVAAGGVIAALLAAGCLQAATIYVNAAQPDDTGDGLTWGAAKQTLGAALSQAGSGDEIWVAAGTYKPTTGTNRTISFVLKAGVGIYGGFVGTETARGQRNWTALGKQFGVDYRTVQGAVRKFGAAVRAAGSGSGVEAWQEALTGHEEVLSEAWRIHANPDATNQERLSALKVAQDSIGQVAALNGVVTKRMGIEHSGKVTAEVDIPDNGTLAKYLQDAADIARGVAGITADAGPDAGDEPGGVGAAESED